MKGQWERAFPAAMTRQSGAGIWRQGGELEMQAQETHGLEAQWACGSERSAGLLHIWEVHNRVCILEPPSSPIPAALQSWPSGPLLIHLSASPCPHLPTKAISSVISKSWVLTLRNVLCPTPTTERLIVSPFSGTLKYCHPPQKSSFRFPPPAHSSQPKKIRCLLWAHARQPLSPRDMHILKYLAFISSGLHPMGPPGGYYLFFHTLI